MTINKHQWKAMTRITINEKMTIDEKKREKEREERKKIVEDMILRAGG
jgi:hypothetical protein